MRSVGPYTDVHTRSLAHMVRRVEKACPSNALQEERGSETSRKCFNSALSKGAAMSQSETAKIEISAAVAPSSTFAAQVIGQVLETKFNSSPEKTRALAVYANQTQAARRFLKYA